MTERAVFLHVGPNKTGSTYIQACLARNDRILSEIGLTYPFLGVDPDTPRRCGHHDLVAWLRGKTHRLDDAKTTDALAEIGAADTVLLSSEELRRATAEELERLASFFSGARLRPVIFIRKTSDLIRSQWQETIKWGKSHDFSEFLAHELISPLESRRLNQKILIDHLANVFGRESLLILNYNRIVDEGADIADALIARLLGRGAPSIAIGRAVNVSMAAGLLETMRVMNAVYRSMGGEPKGVVAAAVTRSTRARQPNVIKELIALADEVIDSAAAAIDVRKLDDRLAQAERMIFDDYKDQLPDGQGEPLFPPARETQIRFVRLADLLMRMSERFDLRKIVRETMPPV